MSKLVQLVEELRERLSTIADGEQKLVASLREALNRFDQKLLQDVLETPGVTDQQKHAARIARILVQYNTAQAAKAAGNAQLAEAHLQTALQERDQLLSEQVALPTLPTELAPPPQKIAPPPAAPETQAEPAA